MKSTITRYSKQLYEWSDTWGYDPTAPQRFQEWLKENGLTRIDSKSKRFQELMMLAFTYDDNIRTFNRIIERGFRF